MTESILIEKKPVAITKLAYGLGSLVSAELKFADGDTEVLYFGKSQRGGAAAFQVYHPSFLDHLTASLPIEETVVEFRGVEPGRAGKSLGARTRELPREIEEPDQAGATEETVGSDESVDNNDNGESVDNGGSADYDETSDNHERVAGSDAAPE